MEKNREKEKKSQVSNNLIENVNITCDKNTQQY